MGYKIHGDPNKKMTIAIGSTSKCRTLLQSYKFIEEPSKSRWVRRPVLSESDFKELRKFLNKFGGKHVKLFIITDK